MLVQFKYTLFRVLDSYENPTIHQEDVMSLFYEVCKSVILVVESFGFIFCKPGLDPSFRKFFPE